MWPFKKSQPKRDELAEQIAELKAFAPVGGTFRYLGRQCVAAHHCHPVVRDLVIPGLWFHYTDDNGVIRSGFVEHRLLPHLRGDQIAVWYAPPGKATTTTPWFDEDEFSAPGEPADEGGDT